MVLLASRHRICIVDMSYTTHFVWNALREERAAGAAASRSALPGAALHWGVGIPPDAGSLLRLPPLLDLRTMCARDLRSEDRAWAAR
eukprot:5920956-Prymnesium_polylepis.1